jgi:hypothetical protein
MFGKDIAIKVGIMFQLKKTINGTLDTIEKAYKRQNPNSSSNTRVYEENTSSSMVEDDYEEEIYEAEDIPNTEPMMQGDNFTQSMNINMPQNPVNPMAGHPKEVQDVLRKSRKK